MKVLYIADDGKEFDNEYDCEDYEWLLNHSNLKDIKCYDKNGKLFENLMDENTYLYSEKIIVPTDMCAKELKELATYTGYYCYSHITEAGIWMVKEHKNDWEFVKVGNL